MLNAGKANGPFVGGDDPFLDVEPGVLYLVEQGPFVSVVPSRLVDWSTAPRAGGDEVVGVVSGGVVCRKICRGIFDFGAR